MIVEVDLPGSCRSRMSQRGHPLAASVNRGNSQPCGLLVFGRRFGPVRYQIFVAHIWFSITGCAIAHQSPIRIKAGRSELAARYTWPLAGNTGPRKPSVPRRVHIHRSHNTIAQYRGFASSDPTPRGSRRGRNVTANGGMAVARNQHDGFANPKAALPPPSHDRQLLFMQRPGYRRTGRLRA